MFVRSTQYIIENIYCFYSISSIDFTHKTDVQLIIIRITLLLGESGSGKTEASKMVLQFIVKATHGDHIVQIIKDKLFVANSVLEAFGNAKTRNNDNSSRFGKYMDVQFNPMVSISGIRIKSMSLDNCRPISYDNK